MKNLSRDRATLSEHRIATILGSVRRFNSEAKPDRTSRVTRTAWSRSTRSCGASSAVAGRGTGSGSGCAGSHRCTLQVFMKDLRSLSAGSAAALGAAELEKRFAELSRFMEQLRKTARAGEAAGAPTDRDRLLDVRRHVEISAERDDSSSASSARPTAHPGEEERW